MKGRRGRRVTWWITGLGLLVLLACGILFKDWVLEEWYLYKLESGDIEEQKAAVQKLAEMGSTRAIPGFIRLLQWPSQSPQLRTPAANALRRIGAPAVPALTTALENENEGIRLLAVDTLGKMGAEQAGAKAVVPVLIERLNDESETVQLSAISALGDTQSREAVPALVELVRSRSGLVRLRAIEALGRVGPGAKGAVPLLSELTEAENLLIQTYSAEALNKIQGGGAAVVEETSKQIEARPAVLKDDEADPQSRRRSPGEDRRP
jgi:HEAT repeat protein